MTAQLFHSLFHAWLDTNVAPAVCVACGGVPSRASGVEIDGEYLFLGTRVQALENNHNHLFKGGVVEGSGTSTCFLGVSEIEALPQN